MKLTLRCWRISSQRVFGFLLSGRIVQLTNTSGWHGLVLSGFKSGESVAVFGAGPVGLMAAYSGILRGASKVYVVDKVKERLHVAERIGATPIDFSQGDPVEQIIKLNSR